MITRLPLGLAILALLLGGASLAPAHAQDGGAPIAPALRALMQSAEAGEQLRAYVVLSDQLRAETLRRSSMSLAPRAHRARVAETLKAHAAETQQGVLAALREAQAAGRATVERVLWMGNAVVFSAEPAVIEALAALPGIDRIRPVVHPETSAQDVLPTRPQAGAQAARLAAQPAAAAGGTAGFPFFEDFESGVLAPYWTVGSSGTGIVEVSPLWSPNGSYHVLLHCTEAGTSHTSLSVTLDLAGASNVGIRFEVRDFSDEFDPEDGLFISPNGVDFYDTGISLYDETGLHLAYQTRQVALDPLLELHDISYTSTFTVRFQWTDNSPINGDGFAFDDIEIAEGAGDPPDPIQPNLTAQQAPRLWDVGIDGSGVLIGTIDSGVRAHPDLADRLWVNPGEIPGNSIDDDANGFIDDITGWNFVSDTNDPASTTDPHGTQAAGLMVGDGTDGKQTGMAPGGTLVVCRIPSEPTALDETQYWAAQQYLLDVGVDVVSSSYSFKWGAVNSLPDYHMHRQLAELERAAGIVHANSIGNQGSSTSGFPVPFNISTPGNVPGPFWHPADGGGGRGSILACGGIYLDDDALYPPSGRGPSAWEDMQLYAAGYPSPQDPAYWDYPYGGFAGGQPGLIKPDLVSYTEVTTTNFPGLPESYIPFGGTSASTPQLGGALALLLQAQPEAEPRHLSAALQLTAEDLGPPGKDNTFGAGKIQVFDAARRLQLLCRVTPEEVSVTAPFDLEVFGAPNELVFGFLGVAITTATGDFNLAAPWAPLSPLPLDGTGHILIPFPPLNDAALVGVSLWFQFGAKPWDLQTWGFGPFLSVPEQVLFLP